MVTYDWTALERGEPYEFAGRNTSDWHSWQQNSWPWQSRHASSAESQQASGDPAATSQRRIAGLASAHVLVGSAELMMQQSESMQQRRPIRPGTMAPIVHRHMIRHMNRWAILFRIRISLLEGSIARKPPVSRPSLLP